MALKSWKRVGPGQWELDGHAIARRARIWWLTTADGDEHDLGTRATFDDAEAIISAL